MRIVLFAALAAASAAVSAVEWRNLASPPDYQSMIDVDTVTSASGVQRFMMRRAYRSAQALPDGRPYNSTRLHFVADCNIGRATTAITAYYGEDRRLVHSEAKTRINRSEFTAPEAGSDIAEALAVACQRVAAGPQTNGEKKAEAQPAPKPVVRGSSSGSGIVISENHVITNQHVVNECDAYEVIDDANRATRASLMASDTQRDLALLSVDKRYATVARVRSDATPKLGESVTVVGYPLANVLGSKPTVGFGHISSTTGIRDNPTQMQISVPIQRGNSGGPVLDQAGNVIGVVVSKLDALKVAQRMGDLPQNVNFAIRGEVLRVFLENNKIAFTASRDSSKLENTDIASQGAAVTVRVRCVRNPAPTTPVNVPAS